MDMAGAVLHVEAVLGGVLALCDDQPGGGLLHPWRRHLREAGGAARERGNYLYLIKRHTSCRTDSLCGL